jgi:hypothetical protein
MEIDEVILDVELLIGKESLSVTSGLFPSGQVLALCFHTSVLESIFKCACFHDAQVCCVKVPVSSTY